MANVLFVEDEPTLREGSGRCLRRRNHSVQLAQDGLEALSVLDQIDGIQIIFTDCNMPRMDGIELAHTIRTDSKYVKYSKLPIIGVGVFPQDKRADLTEYLGKPCDVEEILRCITQYCK
jgi:CheY-like chemotaxis protein